MGTVKPEKRDEKYYGSLNANEAFIERAKDDKDKQKLKDESKAFIEKARAAKNVPQQIRLIINQITPDNLEKKFAELRQIMFANLKHQGEEGYDQSADKLTESLNEENMEVVVQTIFRKA